MIVRDKDGNVVAGSRDSVTWTNRAGGVTAVGEAMSVEMTANERAVLGELLCPVPPRCATCRWAEAHEPVYRDDEPDPKALKRRAEWLAAHSLECTNDNAIGLDYAYCDYGPVVCVAPLFGCVMWEAKP